MSRPTRPGRIAFIGFGEAARAFLTGWAEGRPAAVAAYDRRTGVEASRAAMEAAYAEHAVAGAADPAGAVAGAEAVFCTVTADQALVAAEEAAPHLAPGALWFDCNSCAPGTKRRAAEVIGAAGGAYVDVAVMAPVHPGKHKVPLLIAGGHTARAMAVLEGLGMVPNVAGEAVGQASSIKMIRSIMVKGMEALSAECFLAAAKAGVVDEVARSLHASNPAIEWRRQGAYNLERMVVHGARRAAEMREVARTVTELGLPPSMAEATARWQDRLAGRADASDKPALEVMLARLLSAT